MEEQESTRFVDWINSLTLSGAVQTLVLTVFIIYIIALVIRTFRNKPSA